MKKSYKIEVDCANCANKMEEAARRTPGVQAMTVAAAPRNTAALRLYRRLGYDSLCLVTLRKEFGPNPRDKRCEFLGLSFCI